MKRIVMMLLIAVSLAFVSCGTSRYAEVRDYPQNGYNRYYDPFYGPGYYGRGYYYAPAYGHRYYRNNRYYAPPPRVKTRPPVIRQQPLPPVKVRPINPRTDRVTPQVQRNRKN